jgi:predicted small lipoprotein YifL
VRSMFRDLMVFATVLCLPACGQGQRAAPETATAEAPAPAADKPFVAGGKIEFDLDGGAYEIKAASDNHIRVAVSGTTGNAKVDVGIDGSNANIKVKDTPHGNFHAVVEVPSKSEIVVRLTGGELTIDEITGNKDVESYAGNVRIAVGDPNEYARVDAAVKAGEIKAQPFGGSKSGLLQDFRWSGGGKYTLRAHLGAGNLVLGGQ